MKFMGFVVGLIIGAMTGSVVWAIILAVFGAYAGSVLSEKKSAKNTPAQTENIENATPEAMHHSATLMQRIAKLEQRLAVLEQMLANSQMPPADIKADAPIKAQPSPVPSVTPLAQQAPISVPTATPVTAPTTPHAAVTTPPPRAQPLAAQKSSPLPTPVLAPIALRDRLPKPIAQLFFGGNMLVKLGGLILFLGLAFLLRHTAEHITVPIEVRYASVALVGCVLLALGWFLRHRRPEYALVIQGAGIGIFYLTTLAAMKLHSLLPVTAGFGFLFAVAMLSALLAVLQNAPVLAIIAALEGFAAPILASTGQQNSVGLFSYLLVLDIGILLIAWFKAWRMLNLIGAVGTFTLAVGWAQKHYTNQQFDIVQAFLLVFFLLFVVIGFLFARRTLSTAPSDATQPLSARAVNMLNRVGRAYPWRRLLCNT